MLKRWIDNCGVGSKLSINLAMLVLSVVIIAVAALTGLRTAMEADRKVMLKDAVEVAASYAQGLEEQVKLGKMTREQALSQFAATMAPARYDRDKYFAAYFTNGTYLFHGTVPKLAGSATDVASVTDSSGRHFMQDSITVATKNGGGYYNIAVMAPGETEAKEKVNYAKLIPDWNLVIISGMIISDIDAAVLDVEERMAMYGVPVVLLCIGLVLVIRRSIRGGLNQTAAAMLKLAEGDLSVAIPDARRGDEIGKMSRVLQVFKDNAHEKLRLQDEAERKREAEEIERASREAAASDAARRQDQVVDAMAIGLQRLSQGDLVSRLNEEFPSAYEQLRRDFNLAAETLETAILAVASNAHTIESGTAEISSASDDLSRRTENQAASLEQTAAALDEITATVTRTASGSALAQKAVATVRADAEQAGSVVGNAVKAMAEIEDFAQKIRQIIGVIDEIAFQTNLLALNAGVEAARAGDAGRGFAVVASEVRALAQRSAGAAKEIKGLIESSTQRVSSGVALVTQTGEALTRIFAQVQGVHSAIVEIAASAQEQASGLHQVNAAINQMDQVTQQNAAMVEQSTAASHSLAHEAAELVRLTGRFQCSPPKPAGRQRRPEAA